MLDSPATDERDDHRRVADRPSRTPIVVGLLVAALLTAAIVAAVRLGFGGPAPATTGIAKGRPAPDVTGMTLDGAPFRLADQRGHPVIVNFWGPSCIPCRSEFPLFKAKLAEHASEGLDVVGVLMVDSPPEARAFVAQFGATWPTVIDPDGHARTDYQAVARPQTYFIDRTGVIRTIQIGEVVSAEFERQYATIAR